MSATDKGVEGESQSAPAYSGRLELTWTNKDQRLLAYEDGKYEWVPAGDYRVSEVRLLHDAGTVGQTAGGPKTRGRDNLLIRGDALSGLTSLLELPEFAREFAGKVRLIYIDPPFNTGQAFEHYDDALEHSVWLTMMRDRLVLAKRLLADDGSIWVHCDDAEQARLRLLLDEVFGASNFIATIIWKRRNDPRNTAPHLSTDHDSVIVFAKDAERVRTNPLARTEAMDSAYTNDDEDPRGPWRTGDLAARNYYSKGTYAVKTPSGRKISGPPSGSYWRISKEELERLDAEGRIYWGKKGDSRPYLKRYLSEVQAGRVPSSVWHPEEAGFVRNGKEEVRALVGDVFATPKPEKFIQRVLEIGSDPGSLVLDFFLGSGTTAAVAQKMGRRWIGMESSRSTLETFTLPRLEKVIAGEDPGGISEDTGWTGGGGFRVLDVCDSMFADDAGMVMLADWATNGKLAEATAAQLGFDYEPDGAFCGTQGRTRLAVVDGLVNDDVVRLLVGSLGEEERLTVAGTGVDPVATETLRELRPGSKMRKIPSSILVEYLREDRWQPLVESSEDLEEAAV